MELISLTVLALIGEAVWETLKMTWDKGKFNYDRLGAVVTGLLIAFATGANFFDYIGIPIKIPVVGIILSGLLISRGTNFVHDLLGSVGESYQVKKIRTNILVKKQKMQ